MVYLKIVHLCTVCTMAIGLSALKSRFVCIKATLGTAETYGTRFIPNSSQKRASPKNVPHAQRGRRSLNERPQQIFPSNLTSSKACGHPCRVCSGRR